MSNDGEFEAKSTRMSFDWDKLRLNGVDYPPTTSDAVQAIQRRQQLQRQQAASLLTVQRNAISSSSSSPMYEFDDPPLSAQGEYSANSDLSMAIRGLQELFSRPRLATLPSSVTLRMPHCAEREQFFSCVEDVRFTGVFSRFRATFTSIADGMRQFMLQLVGPVPDRDSGIEQPIMYQNIRDAYQLHAPDAALHWLHEALRHYARHEAAEALVMANGFRPFDPHRDEDTAARGRCADCGTAGEVGESHQCRGRFNLF